MIDVTGVDCGTVGQEVVRDIHSAREMQGRLPVATARVNELGIVGDQFHQSVEQAESCRRVHVNLCPTFAQLGIHRVLLVTSALHMRRSVGVFRHSCPSVDYVPAPTDFRGIYGLPEPRYRAVSRLIPTPRALLDFSDVTHEYVGILYYHLRGWL